MRALGTVTLKTTPPSARVTYHRDGESQNHEAGSSQTFALKAGLYEFTAQAERYESKTQSVVVTAGRQANADIILQAKEQHEVTPSRTLANTVQDPKDWISTDGWWEHPAQGYAWFRINQGTWTFDFLKQPGHVLFVNKTKPIEWVVDYRDEGNRIVYDLDNHQLRRHAVYAGKAEPEVKISYAADSPIIWKVEIDISADHIIIRERNGKVLDEYKRPKPQAPLGKFGFRGPIALAMAGPH